MEMFKTTRQLSRYPYMYNLVPISEGTEISPEVSDSYTASKPSIINEIFNFMCSKMVCISLGVIVVLVSILLCSSWYLTSACFSKGALTTSGNPDNASKEKISSLLSNINAICDDTGTLNQDISYSRECKIQRFSNSILSKALGKIVDFTIQLGGLNFSCPASGSSVENELFPHPFNCRKYYECNYQNESQWVAECKDGLAFDEKRKGCVDATKVRLCRDVEVMDEMKYKCPSIGLHEYPGDCAKFVLCDSEMQPYGFPCNTGDFFDTKLKICLSSSVVSC